MLQDNQIKKIKQFRKQGFSFNKIAKKMNISMKTAIKYGKEEDHEEGLKTETSTEVTNSIEKEDVQGPKGYSLAYREEFVFIKATKDCEARINQLKTKKYGPYNHEIEIFKEKFEHVLRLLRKRKTEGLDALKYIDGELRKFDADCFTAASVRGDIVRLKRERAYEQKENNAQEKKFKDIVVERRRMLMGYDSKIAEKQARLEKLKAEASFLEEKKAAGERAVANIIEEGKIQALYYEKQIKDIREHYNLTFDFAEMAELMPMLESTITQLTEHLRDMNDAINLQENREVLRKPLENLVEVVDVMPLDLFKKLCAAVEKRKATEPAFVQQEMVQRMQSNQPFSHDDMLKTMMTGMAKAINGEDEFDQIMKMKKLQQMMQQ